MQTGTVHLPCGGPCLSGGSFLFYNECCTEETLEGCELREFPYIYNKHKSNPQTKTQDVCDDLLAAETHSRAGEVFVREEGVKGHFLVQQFPTETVTQTLRVSNDEHSVGGTIIPSAHSSKVEVIQHLLPEPETLSQAGEGSACVCFSLAASLPPAAPCNRWAV